MTSWASRRATTCSGSGGTSRLAASRARRMPATSAASSPRPPGCWRHRRSRVRAGQPRCRSDADRRGLPGRWLAGGGQSKLHGILIEEWIEAALNDATCVEVAERVAAGIPPEGALAWWGLTGVLARNARDGADQPMWREWAMALVVQPDLRMWLTDDAPRKVLDNLRMTARERLRALWYHADHAGKWDRLTALEQLGRSGDRRRRWSALDEASSWAPAWAWDVSRGLAEAHRPGRNQEAARIAGWEARHLISAGGEINLIAGWLRAAGGPPPDPIPPGDEAIAALRLGQIARLTVVLGPGDVPTRPEHVRLAARAAAAAGGWAHLRGLLDSIDFTTSDARRALRAAVGATQPKALLTRRGWNALRTRFPRLPTADDIGLGDGQRRREGAADEAAKPRRRRRRRLHAPATDSAPAAPVETSDNGAAPSAPAAESAAAPTARRRRRRRRRAPRAGGAAADGAAPPASEG